MVDWTSPAMSSPGLDQHQHFGRGFDAALPAVNRLHARQDIDAGGQTLLDQAMGDPFGLLAIGAGGKNDLKIGHERSPGSTVYQVWFLLREAGKLPLER